MILNFLLKVSFIIVFACLPFHTIIANTSFNSAKEQKAIADYSLVIKMDGATHAQRAKAYVNRGKIYMQINQLEKAVADFNCVIEMSDIPDELKAEAILNRNDCNNFSNDVQSEQFTVEDEKAFSLLQTNTSFVKTNPKKAIDISTNIINTPNISSTIKALAFFQRGICQKDNDVDNAISDFSKAIEMNDDPDTKADILILRADCYVKKQFFDKAIVDYTAVIATSSTKRFNALLSRGNCHKAISNFSDAIIDYTSIIETENTSKDIKEAAFFQRGFCFYLINDFNNAIPDLSKAIQTTNDGLFKKSALACRAISYEKISEFNKAIADCNHILIIETTKDRNAFLLLRGRCYVALNMEEKAITDFKQIINDPESPEHLKNQAQSFIK